jgi:hypothetical protein
VELSGVEWSCNSTIHPETLKGKIINIDAWADSQSSLAKGPETNELDKSVDERGTAPKEARLCASK